MPPMSREMLDSRRIPPHMLERYQSVASDNVQQLDAATFNQETSNKGSPTSNAEAADRKGAVSKESPVSGNGLFAAEPFAKGQAILSIQYPLVAALDVVHLQDTCANCFLWAEGAATGTRLYVPKDAKVNQCAGCRQVRYCSKKCQSRAWKRSHKVGCPILQTVTRSQGEGRVLPKAVRATIELLTRRVAGIIDEETWSSLLSLESHFHDLRRQGEKWHEIELMARGAYEFSGTQASFNFQFATEIFTRVLTNSLTLITQSYDPLGIILDPSIARANHSCDPNAFVVMDGPEVAIRSLRPIKKDEEIFISYIDTTNPYPRRQWELKDRWHFSCRCSKCAQGPTSNEDKWRIPPGDLSKKWKDTANDIKKQSDFVDHPANFAGNTAAERRVSAIQWKAYDLYDKASTEHDPATAIVTIESAMRICYQSELWYVDRQPYAAMRDCIILNMILAGNHQIAYLQAVKRYTFPTDVLYNCQHHPVQVIQTWELAMLTLYFMSNPDHLFTKEVGSRGIDLSVIASTLLYETYTNCRLSHGPSSSFARSVKNEINMFWESMRRTRPNFGKTCTETADHQKEKLTEMAMWLQY